MRWGSGAAAESTRSERVNRSDRKSVSTIRRKIALPSNRKIAAAKRFGKVPVEASVKPKMRRHLRQVLLNQEAVSL
jgi:hypothetical protein